MEEIGKNLEYPRYELLEFSGERLKVRSVSQQRLDLELSDIEAVELAGVKSASGFSGTMEWGMKNPTFLLPTNILYNIINLFKRRDDIVYCKVHMKSKEILLLSGSSSAYDRLREKLPQRQPAG